MAFKSFSLKVGMNWTRSITSKCTSSFNFFQLSTVVVLVWFGFPCNGLTCMNLAWPRKFCPVSLPPLTQRHTDTHPLKMTYIGSFGCDF